MASHINATCLTPKSWSLIPLPMKQEPALFRKNGWFQDWGTDKPGAAYNRKRNNSNKQWDL